ncbi:MAG: CBS domain-containing protein [Candidatus Altiarchaeales archaeon]|nr:CBS domain-containing protein [Candidatus Altiarchaeales archaeon]
MMVLTPYDYARKKVVYCWLDEPVREVARRLVEENIGSMIVDNREGKHVGMITDIVIFNAISSYMDVCNLKVGDLKLESLVMASMNTSIDEVMDKFKKTGASRIALLDDDGQIAGVLKKKNLDRFARFDAGERLFKQSRR